MTGRLINVAIIDDNIELTQLTAQYLFSLGRYDIVGTARDGERGLELLRSLPVDVALIDLVLPGKDGFYVLEEIAKTPDVKPACIIFSGVGLEYITRKAFEKGADFFILKPFDMALLARRIDEVWEQKIGLTNTNDSPHTPRQKKTGSEAFALDILHDLPISNTLIGYTYLKTAIQLAIDDAEMLESVTKRLYPAVAKQYGSTGPQVERAIRHAIDVAWRKGGGRNYVRIVGYGDPTAPKPTNSAFISTLVELYHHTFG